MEKARSISIAELSRLVREGKATIIPKAEVDRREAEEAARRNPPPPDRRPPVGEFDNLNKAEACRLGLERVVVRGNPKAQDLINRITDKTRNDRFDVANANSKIADAAIAAFVAAWQKDVPSIPVPCVPGERTSYVRALAEGRIIKNQDAYHPIVAAPNFGKSEILWMDRWVERYGLDVQLAHASPLLKELGVNDTGKVTGISREEIDAALWTGDPSNKQKTPQHLALIKRLGLDPTKYNFRLIAQDEYARLAGAGKNFGHFYLTTWFNDCQLVKGAGTTEQIYFLEGGMGVEGGASFVTATGAGSTPSACVAVRLVLECGN